MNENHDLQKNILINQKVNTLAVITYYLVRKFQWHYEILQVQNNKYIYYDQSKKGYGYYCYC